MICPSCRERKHDDCPELARQQSLAGQVVALGSSVCDCQHQQPANARETAGEAALVTA